MLNSIFSPKISRKIENFLSFSLLFSLYSLDILWIEGISGSVTLEDKDSWDRAVQKDQVTPEESEEERRKQMAYGSKE